MKRNSAWIISFMVLGLCAPAQAMTINTSFTSNVTGLTDAAQVESAVKYVAQQYGSLFSNPITINILVDASPGTSILGKSDTNLRNGFNYSEIYTALLADKTSAGQQSVISSLNATNPAPNNNYFLPVAESQVLGLDPNALSDSTTAGSAGTFTFGEGFNYTFDPNSRSVSGEIDFIGVAEHEISEIMGRITGLGTKFTTHGQPAYLPDDLFRYDPTGRSLTTTDNTGVFFSTNGGATDLMNYNAPGNGGDLGDWASGQGPDSFNAFSSSGIANLVSPVDITQMSVLGYNPTSATLPLPVPEPSSLALLAAGSFGLFLLQRSGRAQAKPE